MVVFYALFLGSYYFYFSFVAQTYDRGRLGFACGLISSVIDHIIDGRDDFCGDISERSGSRRPRDIGRSRYDGFAKRLA
jgi:hypothetical protein